MKTNEWTISTEREQTFRGSFLELTVRVRSVAGNDPDTWIPVERDGRPVFSMNGRGSVQYAGAKV